MASRPDNTNGGAGLEDRLRGLILTNASSSGMPTPNALSQEPSQQDVKLPPHLRGATVEDQAKCWARDAAHRAKQQIAPQHGVALPSKKRMNQAQRRQLNAQLTIPIDSRQAPQGQRTARDSPGLHRPAGYNQAQWNSAGPASVPPIQDGSHVSQALPPSFFGSTGSAVPASTFVQQRQYPQVASTHMHQPRHYHGFQASQQHHGMLPEQQHEARVASNMQYRKNDAYSQQSPRQPSQARQLYNPNAPIKGSRSGPFTNNDQLLAQSQMLEELLQSTISGVGADDTSIIAMEQFRALLEQACRDTITEFEKQELGNEEFQESTVQLKCFGSMASGFATKSSDMDLALLSPKSEPSPDTGTSRIPRLLEKKLLDMNLGARLLTKTRVPIIKVCERPTQNLLKDLRDNHEKWAAGLNVEQDVEEQEDDEEDAVDLAQAQLPTILSTAAEVQSAEAKLTRKERLNASMEDRLASFKQYDEEALGDYYARAKKLLASIGGKDIHTSKPIVLSHRETEILFNVSKAFLIGLSDEPLKARLSTYPSLSLITWSEPTSAFKSLSGLYSQVEGERLVMGWESRPLQLSEASEASIVRQIENWWRLVNRSDLDPMSFNKFLFQMADQLKKVPVLQLSILQQRPSEDPASYHHRAGKIMHDLRGSTHTAADLEGVVVKQYLVGIASKDIRARLENLLSENTTLADAARWHHALALAESYERSIDHDHYSGSSKPHVNSYVDIIRSDPRSTITTCQDMGQVLTVLSQLPDPLANNKSRPRDRYNDALEFPKSDIGIQCDINFSAQLALHNTQLLRCYSLTDNRVRPLVLFIKHWAKTREINTPYRGTLSSYGYVLMVLHYLVNVAYPFVCPNLQALKKDPPEWLSPAEKEAQTTCLGKDVRFWRNEKEIENLAQRGLLNHNKDSLGLLLRGFFEYYAQNGLMSTGNRRGFDWGREVLSLRTPGGIVTKQYKGWVGARTDTVTLGDTKADQKTVVDATATDAEQNKSTEEAATTKKPAKDKEETKEIRHRYLFAIEDPFELEHNVARTVTHQGIVAIRDEFRRAWNIIKEVGRPGHDANAVKQGLLDPAISTEWKPKALKEVFEDIHGPWTT